MIARCAPKHGSGQLAYLVLFKAHREEAISPSDVRRHHMLFVFGQLGDSKSPLFLGFAGKGLRRRRLGMEERWPVDSDLALVDSA